MAALVTLEEAKRYLRVTGDEEDADIELQARGASEIVIDYIKRPLHGWSDTTAPALIKVMVLQVLGQLYANRETATLSEPVKAILYRFRDPALA